jgi:uncharacterized protein (TIGR02466 family)
MELLPLNPIPLYITKSEGKEFDNIQKELLELCNTIKFEKIKNWDTYTHSLSYKPFKSNLLQDKKCVHSLEFIKKSVKEYLQSIGFHCPSVPLSMPNSWITKTQKNESAHIHTHQGSHISGVYYIKTNGEDGNLYFPNIHRSSASNPIIGCSTHLTDAPLETGILMLFPSDLSHGVKENRTDNIRYSLSFNIFINGHNEPPSQFNI